MVATVAGIHLGIDTHANRPAANTVPDGSIYSCSTHSLLYKSNYAGNSWATWGTLGGLIDPMTTRGDIVVRNSSNVTARLAVGAANRVLRSDGTDPSWAQVLPADLDVSADNTTADATTGHHGLLLKLGGGSTNFLRADGTWAAPGAGGLTGLPVALYPVGRGKNDGGSTNAGASMATAFPIIVPASMKVRALRVDISTDNSGQLQWGLFDYSADRTAATKLAGGQATPGGTGWRAIAAASAPVTVSPGCYMIVVHQPAANMPTIRCETAADALPYNQWNTTGSYAWDDTPDFSDANWVANVTQAMAYLEGDIDGSGNGWS